MPLGSAYTFLMGKAFPSVKFRQAERMVHMKTLTNMLLAAALVTPVAASAEIEHFGNLDINHNVILTDTLTPEVAKAYGITRSNHRAMLTISASRPDKSGVSQPVEVDARAYVVNLTEQMRGIKMRKVSEGGAVYLIGDFGIAPPEYLKFTVEVTEKGIPNPYKLQFRKEFLEP